MLDHQTEYLCPENYTDIHISQIEVDSYKSIFEKADADTPFVLYKTLKGNDTKIYLSVCYNTDRLKVKKKIQNSLLGKIYEDTTAINSFTICAQSNFSAYVLHYFLELESGNKYLFSVISADSKIANPKFIEENITGRITSN